MKYVITIILAVSLITLSLAPMLPCEEEEALGSFTDNVASIFAPRTIIVAKDGTGDHATIQAGVDAAMKGDTVKVYDGVYKESVNIGSPLTLIGNGTGKTVLDGDGILDHQHLFNVMANDVNITGFEFREGSPHHEFAGVGIYSSGVNVYNNHFFDNTNGVYIAGSPENVIHNNTFDANYRGIRSDMGCDKNTMKDNEFTNSTSVGILYMWANNVTIIRNIFKDNAYHMGMFNSHYYEVGHNLFRGADPGRPGLMVGTSSNNEIHNNTFRDNDNGMSLSTGGDRNNIIRNEFIDNLEGIKIYADVYNNEIHQNSFINNTVYGLNCSASSVTIDARFNWWGSFTGPYDPISNPGGTGDNVSVNVTYSPWLLGEFKNHPPVLDQIGDLFIDEDTTLQVHLSAVDIDMQSISYRFVSNASWVEFNTTSNNLTGIPDNLDVGSYFVHINITDGWEGYAEENITLTVNNTPPTIITEKLPNGTENEEYSFQVQHIEEPGSNWTLLTDAEWLQFNLYDAIIYGTPGNLDIGDFFVHLILTDNNGGRDEVNLTLFVAEVDDPPVMIEPLQNVEFDEDTNFTIDLSNWVIDPDDELTNYSFSGNGNLTVIFNEEERTALMVPKPDWSGFDIGKFTVFGRDVEMLQSIMIEVLPVNDAPANISIEELPLNITEGEAVFLNGSAEDPDLQYGDKLNFSWYSNISGFLGRGYSIQLELVPGMHRILLNVSDLAGEHISIHRDITVIIPIIVPGGNDTDPVNDTDDDITDDDDNTTGPDDDDIIDDDDITITDDDEDDDNNTTDPDDDEESEEKERAGISSYILLALIAVLILIVVLVFITRRKGDEEVLDWDEE